MRIKLLIYESEWNFQNNLVWLPPSCVILPIPEYSSEFVQNKNQQKSLVCIWFRRIMLLFLKIVAPVQINFV